MVRRFARPHRFASVRPARSLLRLERLVCRITPSAVADYPIDNTPGGYTHGAPLDDAPVADATLGGYSGDLAPAPLLTTNSPRLVVATGPGQPSVVHVFDGPTGALLGSISPFGADHTAGARVATGDVTGDGVVDVIAATGPGTSPLVTIFDGKSLTEVSRFTPYESTFTGGVFVAVGDVNGDGRDDVVTTAGDGGGPLVKVFDPEHLSEPVRSFFVYEEEFRGGATLAVGDVNGDGAADIITGAGPGGGPRVVVTSGRTDDRLQDFFAFNNATRSGVSVAFGDVAGRPTVAAALFDGAGNQVRLFADGYQTAMFTPFDPKDGKPQTHTPASVSLKDLTGDGEPELIVATPAEQGQLVKVLNPLSGAVVRAMPAVTPDYVGGLFVA